MIKDANDNSAYTVVLLRRHNRPLTSQRRVNQLFTVERSTRTLFENRFPRQCKTLKTTDANLNVIKTKLIVVYVNSEGCLLLSQPTEPTEFLHINRLKETTGW